MQQEVIILKGLPASGKSTWAKEHMEKNPGKYKRINKDLLREMLDDGKWSKEREKFILIARDNLICESLEQGYSVIVDDTNLDAKHQIAIKNIVLGSFSEEEQKNINIIVKEFNTDVKECIDRDRGRGEKAVGDKVIWDMYNRYLKKEKVIEQDYSLPKAVICDLDGTLAILNGRNPYDASDCESDDINHVVDDIISLYAMYPCKIIFVSGREQKYEKQTRNFIREKVNVMAEKNSFAYELFMRKTGDNRKDYIIKKEIYDAHIKNKYYVVLVLDDRNQVVDMWRKEGLQCFQVADGNF